jgi:hypothetical protein
MAEHHWLSLAPILVIICVPSFTENFTVSLVITSCVRSASSTLNPAYASHVSFAMLVRSGEEYSCDTRD